MADGSTVSRIRSRLAVVVDGLASLLAEVPVSHSDNDGGGFVVIIAPDYYWEDPSAEQRAAQMDLKREYESLAELLRLLLHRAPEDVVRRLDDADKQFRTWLELQSNWSLVADPEANKTALRSDAAVFEEILAVLEVTGTSDVVIVPDTNSLLAKPRPVDYRPLAGRDHFVFLLLPTVLGELDRLKIEHRNPDVREKAKSVIARIKGWRQQGALNSGVTVDKSIIVKARYSEPNMKKTLSWLDGDVRDDRIVAGVVALQAEQPSARIVLVTGDINMQNKADAALIEVAETP